MAGWGKPTLGARRLLEGVLAGHVTQKDATCATKRHHTVGLSCPKDPEMKGLALWREIRGARFWEKLGPSRPPNIVNRLSPIRSN